MDKRHENEKLNNVEKFLFLILKTMVFKVMKAISYLLKSEQRLLYSFMKC